MILIEKRNIRDSNPRLLAHIEINQNSVSANNRVASLKWLTAIRTCLHKKNLTPTGLVWATDIASGQYGCHDVI